LNIIKDAKKIYRIEKDLKDYYKTKWKIYIVSFIVFN
jgi:hypothetical protein